MTELDRAPADLRALVGVLRGAGPAASELHGFFDPRRPLVLARAPGRLDVMGGIADYSGSLVLQLPTQEATLAAVQCDDEPVLRIVSCGGPDGASTRSLVLPMRVLERGEASSYTLARSYFSRRDGEQWGAYVAGVLLVLMREHNVHIKTGLRIALVSKVPEGKGIASSAALEVAAMTAVAETLGVKLDPVELALLCQKVENLVVGAPCGAMDQIASTCGRSGRLLALLCQPAQLQGLVEIPPSISFWGIDSGIRHAVSGSDYSSVRVGAFMGYRILADLACLTVRRSDDPGVVAIDDPRWHGYLANVSPSEFEWHLAPHVPLVLQGNDFLTRYQGTTDAVTQVDPQRKYAVFQPTAHPIYENYRVATFARFLQREPDEAVLRQLGELMYQSHQSYSDCGLGSDGTDLLVRLVREVGPDAGLFGAKITGGGSGGTVAVLARADAGDAVRRVAQQYAERTGRQPVVFSGSSDGAAACGCVRLETIAQ